jgi:UDP-GlcNAc3NAcA epimerase
MKVLTVVGARPQFVKLAPLSLALRNLGVNECVVHTGQHYDESMSQIFFDQLGLARPDHLLTVSGTTHGTQTASMLIGLEEVMTFERPDMVLTVGDTNSTLAGALVAAKLQFRLAHVEAGIRGEDLRAPENVNRVVADQLSDLLYPPVPSALDHLVREGYRSERLGPVGDVMIDAVHTFGAMAQEHSTVVATHALVAKDFVAVTIHRAENTDDRGRLGEICAALGQIARDRRVIFPCHPRTAKQIDHFGLRAALERVELIEPVGFFDMLELERLASVVVSDSGGVHKEAFAFGTPSVIARQDAWWPELVDSGWVLHQPPVDREIFVSVIRTAMGLSGSPDLAVFGGGHAAATIAEHLTRAR